MTLTFQEQERAAYISGDISRAKLLALVEDAPEDEELEEQYALGWDDGYKFAIDEGSNCD